MSVATEPGARSGRAVRLRTAVFVAIPACLLAILLAHPGCSDECEFSSDCPAGQYCSDGTCQAYAADADADGEADGAPEATDEGGADGDEGVTDADADGVEEAEDSGGEDVSCPTGLHWCGGTDCVDWATSSAHCGACDNPCDAGDVCVGGHCVPTSAWTSAATRTTAGRATRSAPPRRSARRATASRCARRAPRTAAGPART